MKVKGYKINRQIGKGSYGSVYSATHSLSGERVAIKAIEKCKLLVNREQLNSEIRILKRMRHANVIQLYEIEESADRIYIVMEYAPGDLLKHISAHSRLSELESCKYFQEIVSGVEYIHSVGVTHRDLKPDNLMIGRNGRIKIVDFGLSSEQAEELRTRCGALCYSAPETIGEQAYAPFVSDIWSMGVILFTMVCGYLPFDEPLTSFLVKKILKGKLQFPDFLTSNCIDLIQKMLMVDPCMRITIDEIKLHPWFNIQKFVEVERKDSIDEKAIAITKNLGFKRNDVLRGIEVSEFSHATATYYICKNSLQNRTVSYSPVKKRSRNKKSLNRSPPTKKDFFVERDVPELHTGAYNVLNLTFLALHSLEKQLESLLGNRNILYKKRPKFKFEFFVDKVEVCMQIKKVSESSDLLLVDIQAEDYTSDQVSDLISSIILIL